MSNKFLAVLLLCMSIGLASCGGGDGGGNGGPTTFTTAILSDPARDGDIALSPQGAVTLLEGNPELVFAGIHPDTGEEYRTFLNFPLGGAGGVPPNAVIVSAFLDLRVDGILPLPLSTGVPLLIDLVSYEPPLIIGDFDRALLLPFVTTSIFPPVTESDIDQHIATDVTPLMQEAQRLGLAAFQVRILRDPATAATPGLVIINDNLGTDREFLAPLLEVTYF